MPIWLQILLVVIVPFCVIVGFYILYIVLCAHTVRDNIVFKNKYERKMYVLKERLNKYQDKVEEKISYLKYKSVYAENLKILHEKSLNDACILDCKYNRKKVK